jgi:hypothetical protein
VRVCVPVMGGAGLRSPLSRLGLCTAYFLPLT